MTFLLLVCLFDSYAWRYYKNLGGKAPGNVEKLLVRTVWGVLWHPFLTEHIVSKTKSSQASCHPAGPLYSLRVLVTGSCLFCRLFRYSKTHFQIHLRARRLSECFLAAWKSRQSDRITAKITHLVFCVAFNPDWDDQHVRSRRRAVQSHGRLGFSQLLSASHSQRLEKAS